MSVSSIITDKAAESPRNSFVGVCQRNKVKDMSDIKTILSYELSNIKKSAKKIWESSDFYTILGIFLTVSYFIIHHSYIVVIGTVFIIGGLILGRFNKIRQNGEYVNWERERKGITLNKQLSEKDRNILMKVGIIEAEIKNIKKEIRKTD